MSTQRRRIQNRIQQRGFSLLETLIAMVVFTVGFMGVSQYTGNALKRSADDNSRAISLSSMSRLLTPLYVAAAASPADFKTSLDAFTDTDGVSVTGNNGKDTFTVKVLEAKDDSGTSIIGSTTPTSWISPITLGVTVTYSGLNGNVVSMAPYTFILTP